MKIKYVSSLVFAAAALVAVVQAQQVVSYYAEIPNVPTDSPQTLSLPGFDSALGNLTEVKLTYTGQIWQSVFGENIGNASTTYDLSTTTQLALAKADGPTLFSPPSFSLKRKGGVGAYDGTTDSAGASGVRFDQSIVTDGIYIDPELAHYIGVDAINFKASASSVSQLLSEGIFAKGLSVSILAGLSVDYTFTSLASIPEPSAYAALMGGAVLLGILRQRRRLTVA